MADPIGNGAAAVAANGAAPIRLADFGPVESVTRTKQGTQAARRAMVGAGVGLGEELGRSGLRHWGGFVFEEWLRELQQGQRAAQVYREMMDQDPVIGAVMYAIQGLMRRVSWSVKPADSSREAKQGADWFESVINDMRFTWADTISEILSFLGYGYAYHEMVYKLRSGESRDRTQNSRFDDGTIGLAKIPLRAQDTLWKWVFDDTGEIEGFIQNPPPDYLLRFVPIEKALLFRTTIFKDNPEGRSILRNAYRPWYFKRNLESIEGIGVERDLAGLPVLTAPAGADLWNTNDAEMVQALATAKALVSSIRRDEQEGIVLPGGTILANGVVNGWKLELLSTGGRRQFDTNAIISRYDNRIATSMLADLVTMGQDKVGSYALAVTKKDLFAVTQGSYLDIISSQFNGDCIDTLWRLNGFTWPKPTLEHGAVETTDLDTLGNYIMRLAQSEAPINWEQVLPFTMNQAGMPVPPDDYDYTPRPPPQATTPDKGPTDRLVAKAADQEMAREFALFQAWRNGNWEGR